MEKKKIGIIVVIIIALAIIAGVFVAQKRQKVEINNVPNQTQQQPQTTDQKNNQVENLVQNEDANGWKTYTNDKYGFEFKYPSNWMPTYYDRSSKSADVNFYDSSNDGAIMLVFHISNVQEWSLNERKKLNESASSSEKVSMENIILSGVPALKTEYGGNKQAVGSDDYYFVKNGKSINFSFEKISNENILEIENKVTSSFKLSE